MDPKKRRSHQTNECVSLEKKACIDMFNTWSCNDQVDFLCHVLSKMSHFQQSQVNTLLEPLLKRDFIVAFRIHGVPHLAEAILSQLDAPSLLSAERVSRGWQWSVAKYQLWRRLIVRRVAADPVWYGLADRRGWLELINLSDPMLLPAALGRRFVTSGTAHKLHEFPLFTSKSACSTGRLPETEAAPQALRCPCGSPNASDQSMQHSNLSAGHYSSSDTSAHCEAYPLHETSNRRHTSCSSDADSVSLELVMFAHQFYKQLYPRIIREIKRVEDNWSRGNYHLTRIPCRSDVTKGVYCLQYDKEKIVSGLRDDTIKVWRRLDPVSPHSPATRQSTRVDRPGRHLDGEHSGENRPVMLDGQVAAEGVDGRAGAAERTDNFPSDAGTDGYHCTQVLEGHTGSVLCLQYIGNLLISGSSDTTVRLWDLSTGQCLNVICHHNEAVLHLRFRNKILVTCSKDRSIAVWDMGPWPQELMLRQVLVGHRAAVNVVDFDDKYIVSASGDRTIKVWDTETCAYVRTLTGHRRGIACLQYRDRLVVSGSSDNTIRIWDIETGVCFRVLEGHEELVRCIRFDSKHIVSGAYDGKIKVWSLKHALDPRSKPSQLCIHTLKQHAGRVFRLQFDDFQIVSSSHDDTILIWDFVRPSAGSEERDDGFDDGIHSVLSSQASRFLPGPSGANPENSEPTDNAELTPTPQTSRHSPLMPIENDPAGCMEVESELSPPTPHAAPRTGAMLGTQRVPGANNNIAFNRIPDQSTGDHRDSSLSRPSQSDAPRNT